VFLPGREVNGQDGPRRRPSDRPRGIEQFSNSCASAGSHHEDDRPELTRHPQDLFDQRTDTHQRSDSGHAGGEPALRSPVPIWFRSRRGSDGEGEQFLAPIEGE
jgi:hypothetical protein